jgi:hypothetical protein
MAVASITKPTNQAAFLKYKPPIKSNAKLASGKATWVNTWLPRVNNMKKAKAAAMAKCLLEISLELKNMVCSVSNLGRVKFIVRHYSIHQKTWLFG